MPLPATLFVPDFLREEKYELHVLLAILRDGNTTQVYLLLLAHADFDTGEFLGGYHRLMELCTPPQPERGRRRSGPSLRQMRNIVDDLENYDLVRRDKAKNAAQGQLRLWVSPRKKGSTSERLEGRIKGRVKKSQNLIPMRSPEVPTVDLGQGNGQGYQGLNSISPTPLKNGTYPQTEAAKKGKAALKALQDKFKSSPPTGGRKVPPR